MRKESTKWIGSVLSVAGFVAITLALHAVDNTLFGEDRGFVPLKYL